MKKQRILAMLTAVLTLITCFVMPIHAADALVLSLTDDVPEGGTPSLGDTITYTVSITANEGGFCAGAFCFLPSDTLQYESATFLGDEAEAKPMSGDNEGAYGLTYLEKEPCTVSDGVLCTMTFRVVGLGDATVRFYAYQLIDDALNPVEVELAPDTLTHAVATPDKPSVLTESLKDGVVGKTYSAVLESDFQIEIDPDDFAWEVISGDLPEGLELLNDGTLTGTPEEFGIFTFSVTFSLFDSIVSDEKELTLTILERPKELELADESTYTIGDEDGYLRNVVAETTLTTLLSHFQNAESIKVFNAKGNEITDESAYIGTGYVVSLMDGDEAVDSATVIVRGDVGGDGEIGTNDYTLIKAHFLEKRSLTGAYLVAAHVSGQDTVGTADYMLVKAHFLEKKNIYA